MMGTIEDATFVWGANRALTDGLADMATCLVSALQMVETFCELTPGVDRVKLAGVETALEEALGKAADTLRKVAALKGERSVAAESYQALVDGHMRARHEDYRAVAR